jgi:uncharacterized membrane protein YkgB
MTLTISTKHITYFARLVLFVDFFYFGFLKIIEKSPATELVTELQEILLPFIDSSSFLIFLGIVECAIGISLLFPKYTKYAVIVMLLHMSTTFMPLIFLPSLTWDSFLVPTLIGQYILKNFILIALALTIYRDWKREES